MAAASVSPVTTELGHALPPEGPHTITMHVPGWDTAVRFRNGDKTIWKHLTSIYPRFAPFGLTQQLAAALGRKLGANLDTDGVLLFTDPAAFALHQAHGRSPWRKENKLAEGDLTFRVVDVHGIRLYCIIYPLSKTPGVVGFWQNAGIGVSTRLAEALLPHVDSDQSGLVAWSGDVHRVPPPTALPQGDAHAGLRRRIRDLLHRAPLDPDRVAVKEDDVFCYQTGMAAIYRLQEALVQLRPGTILVLGSVFHNTYHLIEESTSGLKHFGVCTAASGVMDQVEQYLEAHYSQGNKVSYVFLEFPSNPLLVSADLQRLRQVADKYAFPIVIDDTVGSFANIDVLPVADFLVSSLTKSFSGYADVMAGSVVLNPLSPWYVEVKSILKSSFRNELFIGDAERLLANSQDYLARSLILNRNAAALAAFLSSRAASPSSPIQAVLYPTTADTRSTYESFMRPPTPDFTPGYGCLLSIDFRSLDAAKAFYDHIPLHCGPHLGAHRTLVVPLNLLVFGKLEEDAVHHAQYGARQEQVRISTGLEPEEELIAAVQVALAAAEKAFAGEETAAVSADEVIERTGAAGKSEEEVKVAAEATSANFG